MDEKSKVELFREIDALYESLVLKPERELKKAEASIRASVSAADRETVEHYIAKARADAQQREQITRAYLRESARNQKLEDEKLQSILTHPVDLGALAEWLEDEDRGATFLEGARQGTEPPSSDGTAAQTKRPMREVHSEQTDPDSFEAIVARHWDKYFSKGKKVHRPPEVYRDIAADLEAAKISMKDNLSTKEWQQVTEICKRLGKPATWPEACRHSEIRSIIKSQFHEAARRMRPKSSSGAPSMSSRPATSKIAVMPIAQKSR
jgi:hypothetical protein